MGNRLSAEDKEKRIREMIAANNLAVDYLDQGRWYEAEGPALRAMAAFTQMLGANDPLTLTNMEQVVHVYKGQGRLKEAESLIRKIIGSRRKVMGDEDPTTLESKTILASIFRDQGRLQEAESLGGQLLEAKGRVLGVNHVSTLKTASNLVVVLGEQKRWLESEELARQVLRPQVLAMGDDDPTSLNIKLSIAAALVGQERWEEAEELLIVVVEAKKRTRPEHPDTLGTISSLAMCYLRQGRLSEAGEVQAACCETCLKIYGLNHSVTRDNMENLILVYKSQGREKEIVNLKRKLRQAATAYR